MNILGKELSEKTASLIKEITQCHSKPVEYRFTDPSKTSSYGQCDAVILYNRCNRYLVAKRHTGRKEYTDFASAEMDYPGTRIVFPPTAASGG